MQTSWAESIALILKQLKPANLRKIRSRPDLKFAQDRTSPRPAHIWGFLFLPKCCGDQVFY
jgi:hypothetical protein